MSMIKPTVFTASLLLICVLLLYGVRLSALQLQTEEQHVLWSDAEPFVADSIVAGPLAGLAADFKLLDVFAMYYQAQVTGRSEDFAYIKPYLNRAQHLDPQFYDVYRLASSLLAFDAKQPQAAIDLLQKGLVVQRAEAWEFLFVAGFIAHDNLNNDKLAFELLSQLVGREGVPVLVMTLASRFLESTSTTQDAIVFLQGLLQLLPEEYHQGIKDRIQAYQDGTLKRAPGGGE